MRRHGLPGDAEAIVARHLRHWAHLDAEERDDLLAIVDWLLRRKTWEAANGFALDDTIRVVIAAQAALLVLGLSVDHYRYVSTIIVYPAASVAIGERAGPAGTRTRTPLPIHGMAQDHRGPVLVAWDQASASARHPERGHNVVIHEFAHKIDMSDGYTDGTPPLRGGDLARWNEILADEYERSDLRPSDRALRPYAWTNPGEFFAVATEAFFCTPASLRDAKPDLYQALGDFYRQDPAGADSPG